MAKSLCRNWGIGAVEGLMHWRVKMERNVVVDARRVRWGTMTKWGLRVPIISCSSAYLVDTSLRT